MEHVSVPRHPGASKFISGQRMHKLAITEPTNAAIYTELCTSVFCFVGLLEMSQAWGCIWTASSPFHDDVKVVFMSLMHLEGVWSFQLDCVSKVLSQLFQWNPDYMLKMVAASRSTYPTHLERTFILLVFMLASLHACFKYILFGSFGSLFRFGAESSNICQLLSKARYWGLQCLKVCDTFGK